MRLHPSPARRFLVSVAALTALVASAAACGSDDPVPEVPEGGTGSVFNDAIIASESHDEVLIGGGTGEMLVAVDCDPDAGDNLVTVVASGLEQAVFTATFEPPIDAELMLDTTRSPEVVATVQTTLDAEEYTVTFADIEGAEFTVQGCSS